MTVPINVQSATEDHSVRFHQYHLEDMGRVRVRKIGKSHQLTKEQVIPISGDELRDLLLPTAKAIEIEVFVPRSPSIRSASARAPTSSCFRCRKLSRARSST
ncbi:hypothetical protein GCM10010255_78680 [Streptomyces coeruleofuscus]|uniref:Ku domain-containing protein n=1 Tax=Streptomyces coeruleofuscus TaxID=66879 RepID=A0ABP5WDP7_9ACTN